MPSIFEIVYFILDLSSVAILMHKVFNLRSPAGLSRDMYVCMTISSVMFPVCYFDKAATCGVSENLVIMVIQAVCSVVSFVAFSRMPQKDYVRPFFCHWRTLVVGTLATALAACMLSRTLAQFTLLVPLYLDAASRIPQLWLVSYESSNDPYAAAFFAATISSRVVEACSWMWLYSFNDLAVLGPVILQAFFGLDFLYFYCTNLIRALRANLRSHLV